jgi:hypothetical protein
MTTWTAIFLGSIAVYSWKLLGHLVPTRILESKFLTRLAGFITIALLMGLVGVQTFVVGATEQEPTQLVIDARVLALGSAALLLVLRAPFIVVVIVAAAIAALSRQLF